MKILMSGIPCVKVCLLHKINIQMAEEHGFEVPPFPHSLSRSSTSKDIV